MTGLAYTHCPIDALTGEPVEPVGDPWFTVWNVGIPEPDEGPITVSIARGGDPEKVEVFEFATPEDVRFTIGNSDRALRETARDLAELHLGWRKRRGFWADVPVPGRTETRDG